MSLADNLIANETIDYEAKKHWISPLRDSLIPILLLLAAYGVGWISPESQTGITGALGNLLDLIRNILLIVSVVWVIYNVLVWRSAEFAVTNLRVIREEGFISKRQSATLLANVSDVKSRVPALGGPLGYGDLTIFTQSGGAGSDTFKSITGPIVFRDKIMAKKMADAGMVEAAATRIATSEPVAARSAAPDSAATLAQLAALRDSGAITPAEYEAKKTEILARI